MAVIESKGNGYSLFNEVKLPSLPEWDKATYPYAHIAKHGDGVRYRIYLTALPLNADTELNAKLVTNTSVAVAITPLASIDDIFNSNWGSFSESEKAAGATVINAALTVVWSNYDILNKADNSVYLAASEPISLDGMNVIEWDGDTTELYSPANYWYHLSSASDVDVNKPVALVRDAPTGPEIQNELLSDSGDYYALGFARVVTTANDTYSKVGIYGSLRNANLYLTLFAYYPIAPAEPEQPEIDRKKLFLLYKIFSPDVFYAITGKKHWAE